jgi:hypothetical protein
LSAGVDDADDADEEDSGIVDAAARFLGVFLSPLATVGSGMTGIVAAALISSAVESM